jgi:hypothetical protein
LAHFPSVITTTMGHNWNQIVIAFYDCVLNIRRLNWQRIESCIAEPYGSYVQRHRNVFNGCALNILQLNGYIIEYRQESCAETNSIIPLKEV